MWKPSAWILSSRMHSESVGSHCIIAGSGWHTNTRQLLPSQLLLLLGEIFLFLWRPVEECEAVNSFFSIPFYLYATCLQLVTSEGNVLEAWYSYRGTAGTISWLSLSACHPFLQMLKGSRTINTSVPLFWLSQPESIPFLPMFPHIPHKTHHFIMEASGYYLSNHHCVYLCSHGTQFSTQHSVNI